MNENELKQKIKSTLDDMTNNIDVASQVKLNEARHAALNQTHNKSLIKRFSLLGSVIAVILVVTSLWYQSPIKETAPSDFPWLEDLEILATEADPEFYQDLEFLAWLEENQLLETEI